MDKNYLRGANRYEKTARRRPGGVSEGGSGVEEDNHLWFSFNPSAHFTRLK